MKALCARLLLVGLAVLLVVGVPAAVAGSGVGGVFNLGVSNSVNAQTLLSGSTNAPQLRVNNTNTGGSAYGLASASASPAAAALIGANSSTGVGVKGASMGGIGLYGQHTATTGTDPAVRGDTASTDIRAIGVLGQVTSATPGNYSAAVRGINNGTGTLGIGVWGTELGSGMGVYGSTLGGGFGVLGLTISGFGVYGQSQSGDGVNGLSESARGVYGEHRNPTGTAAGVEGLTRSTAGGAVGVLGQVTPTSPGGFSAAVRGINAGTGGLGIGVWGSQAGSGWGVYGTSPNGIGVYGQSSGGIAGFFSGNVQINGNLTASGTKNFRIDDPLDPAHKYLLHAAIESNQVLNVYSGNVTTDGKGTATVALPAYFDRINTDPRYQLTVIGQFAQAIVGQKEADNQFVIRTSKPNVQVSWQVTARRNDAYMRAHPFQAEQAKTGEEQGKYVDPQAYGKPASNSIVKTPPLPQPPPASTP
jgi:hypothetical protein